MRKQIKPAPDVKESELRAIERQESELRALENDDAHDEMYDEMQDDEADASGKIASTTVDLAHLGLEQLAYIRRATINDVPVWSIYSASGLEIGAAPTLEKAWGAIVQNDLQPVFVH